VHSAKSGDNGKPGLISDRCDERRGPASPWGLIALKGA